MTRRVGVLAALVVIAVGGLFLLRDARQPERLTPARAGADTILDLAYDSEDARQRLDVYTPEGAGPFPTIIWFHPGGWRAGDKGMSMPIWDWTNRGYAIVSVNYRYAIAPNTVADSVADARAAVDYVFDNHADLLLDSDRIGVYGFSAGGHLAAMVAADESRLAAAAIAAAPTDFAPLLDLTDPFFDLQTGEAVALVAETRLGCERHVAPGCDALATAASPAQLPGGTVPRLVVHGADDQIVAVDHAIRYVDSLADDLDVELVIVPGGNHSAFVERGGVARYFDEHLLSG